MQSKSTQRQNTQEYEKAFNKFVFDKEFRFLTGSEEIRPELASRFENKLKLTKEGLIEFYEDAIQDHPKLGDWVLSMETAQGENIWIRSKGTKLSKDFFAVKCKTIIQGSSIPNLYRSILNPEERMKWDASEYAAIEPMEVIDGNTLIYYTKS
jgi:hypothetical protein